MLGTLRRAKTGEGRRRRGGARRGAARACAVVDVVGMSDDKDIVDGQRRDGRRGRAWVARVKRGRVIVRTRSAALCGVCCCEQLAGRDLDPLLCPGRERRREQVGQRKGRTLLGATRGCASGRRRRRAAPRARVGASCRLCAARRLWLSAARSECRGDVWPAGLVCERGRRGGCMLGCRTGGRVRVSWLGWSGGRVPYGGLCGRVRDAGEQRWVVDGSWRLRMGHGRHAGETKGCETMVPRYGSPLGTPAVPRAQIRPAL